VNYCGNGLYFLKIGFGFRRYFIEKTFFKFCKKKRSSKNGNFWLLFFVKTVQFYYTFKLITAEKI